MGVAFRWEAHAKKIVVIVALAAIVAGVRLGTGLSDPDQPRATVALAVDVPGGDAITPANQRSRIFEQVKPPVQIRESSLKLVGLVEKSDRLHAAALRSTEGTAALSLVEESSNRPWGELTTPAQRAVFKAFAREEALGEWLIVLVDINVYGLFDPVPLTAYRWARPEVEAYEACGIPATGIPADGLDACTHDFYRSGDVVVFRLSAGRQGPGR